MTKKMALASTLTVVVAAAVVAVAMGGPDDEERPSVGVRAEGKDVRGCDERVEGFTRIVPRFRRDSVIGQIAFIGLPITYRDYAARPDPEADPHTDITHLKSVLWVKTGKRVTLTVPKNQRAWMRLVYERPKGDGVKELTVQACANPPTRRAQRRACVGAGMRVFRACRLPYTEFNGAVGIDFDAAPERGRCAELIVSAHGERPLRKPIFGSAASDCDEPVATG